MGGEFVLHHELSQITHDLGGWCDLDNVAEKQVGVSVLALDLFELVGKAKGEGLELQVSDL